MDTPSIPSGAVVVGVDGSGQSDQALDWAAGQAALEHRPLAVVNATGTIADVAMGQLSDREVDRVLKAMATGGQQIVADSAARALSHHPALEIHTAIRSGDPRLGLVDLAREAAALVVGSRGLGPVRRLLLGSVSLSLSRHAPCPVVVVRPRHPGHVRHGVLVGADGTPSSLPVLETAYRQASLRDLPLTVMHCAWEVVTSPTGSHAVPGRTERLDDARLLLAESVAGMTEKFPDVNVTLELCRGLPSDCLVTAAARMDLVVVGRHHRRAMSHLIFGNVADLVVERAASVVTVVPEP